MTIIKPRKLPLASYIQVKPGHVSCEFAPLGTRLLLVGDRPETIAAAAAACRGWEGESDPAGACLRLTLNMRDDMKGDGEPEICVSGPYLRIEGGGVDAWADAISGVAECALAGHCHSDPEKLRDEILDPLLLFLLTRNGRTPVHAAGFMAGDLAILLAGPSGAGKSCLALAAQEAGFPLLSDDIVYVQLRPTLRVRGIPRPVHLFPEDAPPGSDGALRLRNGKLKRAIAQRPGAAAIAADKAALCIIQRGEAVSLAPIGPAEAMAGWQFEPGFDLLQGQIEEALEALTRGGAWRVTLSADPREAIDLLARNLDRLGAPPPP